MTAVFRVNNALPQLAWIAEVDRKNLAISATVGNRVECGRDFLVVGVWNGSFDAGDFAETDCFFGTGLAVRDGSVMLVPSAAVTDAIYYCEHDDRLIAANSLPLLLAATGDQLDPQFEFYDRISDSIHDGVDAYEKSIPTARGSVLRVFFRNLRVTQSSIEEIDKRRPPAFPDFASYLSYLTENYASICRNIRDPRRRHRLDIVSTQSRGYDTTAVNTIAAKHGIDNVFTIAEAYEAGHFAGTVAPSGESDDGSEMCAALGLRAIQLDRRRYEQSFDDEYLFYATAHRADSANLLGMKPHLNHVSVLLTGMLGDMLWATETYYRVHPELLTHFAHEEQATSSTGVAKVSPETLGDDLRGTDIWAHGLSELGIEWGFLQLGPIFIGGRNRPEIFRLTMSEEMAPWRLGNDYDRPIARRIAEEIGAIPRHLFGQNKMATLTRFPLPPVPVGAQLRREYLGFLREHRLVSPLWRWTYRWVHRINARIYHAPWGYYRYIYYIRRLLSKLARHDIEIPMLYRRLNGRLYCFCVNKRAAEYERALQTAG